MTDPFAQAGTYEDLGGFLSRHSPYPGAQFPDFGPGTLEGEKDLLEAEDQGLDLKDKHIILERGPFWQFNEENINVNIKSADVKEIDGENQVTLQFDGETFVCMKAVRIEYRHKLFGKEDCKAVFFAIWPGDSH